MAMAPIDAVCTKCGTKFNQVPTRSFIGFQKLECPVCQKKVTYPLTNGYRGTYWVLLVLMALMMVSAFSRGEVGFPGGIGLAILYGIFMDRHIRNRIAKAASL